MGFTVNINFLKQKNKRKKILHLISEAIIVVSSFLLVFPFYGTIDYHLVRSASNDFEENKKTYASLIQNFKKISEIYSQLQKIQNAENTSLPEKSIPTKLANMLIIPKIGAEINIVEGKNENALFNGAWRLPGTSTPDDGGNTVIGGHRWRFRPPSKRTFYNLDKLEKGDEIQVIWQNKEYLYRVREIKIVKPEEVEILENTTDDILTLFTCTPLFSTKFRLVVVAEKENSSPLL